MPEVTISSAFIVGFLMFLAPCTFPIVPAYLGFISGVSGADLKNPKVAPIARRKIIINAASFLTGFSLVLILIFGAISFFIGEFLGEHRFLMARIGGIFIIIFGLMMLGVIKIPFLQQERRIKIPSYIKPGNPASSFAIGAIFSLGWSPCIGPIFGTIIGLAAISTTAANAIMLLVAFSIGLSVPFMAVAVGFASATGYISKYLNIISVIGGVFLVLLGFLLLTNNFSLLVQYGYELFDFIKYESLLEYL